MEKTIGNHSTICSKKIHGNTQNEYKTVQGLKSLRNYPVRDMSPDRHPATGRNKQKNINKNVILKRPTRKYQEQYE